MSALSSDEKKKGKRKKNNNNKNNVTSQNETLEVHQIKTDKPKLKSPSDRTLRCSTACWCDFV